MFEISGEYPFNENGTCLLLGSKEFVKEYIQDGVLKEKSEFSEYGICKYGYHLPLDDSCYNCKVLQGLSPEDIKSRLSKKPNNL
jgi:hypothetical protein